MKAYNTLLVALVMCTVFSIAGYFTLSMGSLVFIEFPDMLSFMSMTVMLGEFILLGTLMAAECAVVLWACFLTAALSFMAKLKS